MFSIILRSLMHENKESLEDLARALGSHPNAIKHYLYRGGMPSAQMLKKLAAHYKISIDYMLGETADYDACEETVKKAEHIGAFLLGFSTNVLFYGVYLLIKGGF